MTTAKLKSIAEDIVMHAAAGALSLAFLVGLPVLLPLALMGWAVLTIAKAVK